MDTSKDSSTTTSSSLPTLKQRPPPAWVPCPGMKRKAHIADLGDKFDPDCSPSPAKQFAVDEEVATDILHNGFFYDPAIPPSPINVNQSPLNEVEMEEERDFGGEYVKGPGETPCSTSSMSTPETALIDEKGCRDDSVITSHSMHESPQISSKSESLVMKGLSLILSNEIQETLTRRKLNVDCILPKSIVSQMSGTNTSMALIPWKPPVKMENLFMKQLELSQKEQILREQVVPLPRSLKSAVEPESPPASLLLKSPKISPKTNEIQLLQTVGEEDGEFMDVDMSL